MIPGGHSGRPYWDRDDHQGSPQRSDRRFGGRRRLVFDGPLYQCDVRTPYRIPENAVLRRQPGCSACRYRGAFGRLSALQEAGALPPGADRATACGIDAISGACLGRHCLVIGKMLEWRTSQFACSHGIADAAEGDGRGRRAYRISRRTLRRRTLRIGQPHLCGCARISERYGAILDVSEVVIDPIDEVVLSGGVPHSRPGPVSQKAIVSARSMFQERCA